MLKICKNCSNNFEASKNDNRIKFCSEKCRIEYRKISNYMKNYNLKNIEKIREYRKSEEVRKRKNEARRLKYKTDEKYRQILIAKSKNYRLRNPNAKMRQDLKSKYGMSINDYIAMLKSQNYVCAICGRSDSGDSNSKRLYVDHDHITGKIRGLLCSQCNMGLGKFYDNKNYLKRAILYLERNE